MAARDRALRRSSVAHRRSSPCPHSPGPNGASRSRSSPPHRHRLRRLPAGHDAPTHARHRASTRRGSTIGHGFDTMADRWGTSVIALMVAAGRARPRQLPAVDLSDVFERSTRGRVDPDGGRNRRCRRRAPASLRVIGASDDPLIVAGELRDRDRTGPGRFALSGDRRAGGRPLRRRRLARQRILAPGRGSRWSWNATTSSPR